MASLNPFQTIRKKDVPGNLLVILQDPTQMTLSLHPIHKALFIFSPTQAKLRARTPVLSPFLGFGTE